MVVSPRPSHSFGIPVVWYNVVVVGELFVADRTDPVLFNNLPVQEFPRFSGRPEFPISPGMMGIFNASNTGL
jgi:hypothetical protein